MDATTTIVIGIASTVLGGIGLAMVMGQQKLSAQLATLAAQMEYVSRGVAEFYSWRTKELEARANRRTARDTGKHS